MPAMNNILALAVLALGVTAAPQPTLQERASVTGKASPINFATYPAKHGAVAVGHYYLSKNGDLEKRAPEPTPAPTARPKLRVRADTAVTFAFTNSFTADVSTAHAQDPAAPTFLFGNAGPGVIPVGGSDSFAVPSGWNGNVAFVENGGGRAIIGDESLFEASFVNQGGPNPYIDIDVSYVTGFSVPIVCSCDGLGVVSGCNKYLWDLGTCPSDNGVGSCRNPQRNADTDDAQPDPFFAPCAGPAFTVPREPGANINNVCQSGLVECCIGPACPANPKQS